MVSPDDISVLLGITAVSVALLTQLIGDVPDQVRGMKNPGFRLVVSTTVLNGFLLIIALVASAVYSFRHLAKQSPVIAIIVLVLFSSLLISFPFIWIIVDHGYTDIRYNLTIKENALHLFASLLITVFSIWFLLFISG